MGPVRRDDIPLSAIDFHVSDIVPSLLMNDDIFKAASDAAQLPGSGCDDAEQAVKKAISATLSCVDLLRRLLSTLCSATRVVCRVGDLEVPQQPV